MNGVDLIFGIFNFISTISRMGEDWRKRGYAFKVFFVLGLILLGAVAIGFLTATVACFKTAGNGVAQVVVFGFLGVICVLLAAYAIFYFVVLSVSLVIIISKLISKQNAVLKEERDPFSIKQAKPEAKKEPKILAKDQYQQESFEALRPKKQKRMPFKQQLEDTSTPYLKTKLGFDVAMLVVVSCVFVLGIFLGILAAASV